MRHFRKLILPAMPHFKEGLNEKNAQNERAFSYVLRAFFIKLIIFPLLKNEAIF